MGVRGVCPTGDWGLRSLLDELTNRGLTAPAGRKTPEKALELSHFHKLLRHPYYKGRVRYRGAEYDGKHEPLVSEKLWDQVQQMLVTKNQEDVRIVVELRRRSSGLTVRR